jgi:hypothetical protein
LQQPAVKEVELSPDEIKKLLNQAKAEALENMKPRKPKQGPPQPLDPNILLGLDSQSSQQE